MKYNFTGKICKIHFPFNDVSNTKGRPALAISEPDCFGDIQFLLITTDKYNFLKETITIPEGILPFPSVVHTAKAFFFKKSIIIKEISEIEIDFLKKILKKTILSSVQQYYEHIHLPLQKKEFVGGKSKIHYAQRVFNEKEMVHLTDACLEFWLTHGRYAKAFERKISKYLNVKYTHLVNSGSSANLLAFMCLTSPLLEERQVKRGHEIITVAAGFPTTIAPIIQYGAVPVFVDIDLETFNIDTDKLEQALSPLTKGVMLAHTLGNPFDIYKLKDFCNKYNLWLIEDNCDALGSRYAGRLTGTWGDIGTSSFYPAHHITTGEGGAVYTDDPLLNKILLSLRDWGKDCWCNSGRDNTCKKRFNGKFGTLPSGYDHKYVFSHFGYNLKATDLQAAVGYAQIEKIAEFTEKRKENYHKLYQGLKKFEEFFTFAKSTPRSDPSWFGFLITLKDNVLFGRNQLTEYLEYHRIQTRSLFAGNITRHPCFDTLQEGSDYRIAGELNNTDKVMNDSFWIGVYPGMKQDELDYMIEKIITFVKENR